MSDQGRNRMFQYRMSVHTLTSPVAELGRRRTRCFREGTRRTFLPEAT